MRRSPKPLILCQRTCSLPTKVSCRHIGSSGTVPSCKTNAILASSLLPTCHRHRTHRLLLQSQRRRPRSLHQEVPITHSASPQQPRSERLPHLLVPNLEPRHSDPQPQPPLSENQRLDPLLQPRPLGSLRSQQALHRLVSQQSLPLVPLLRWGLRVRSVSLPDPQPLHLDKRRSLPWVLQRALHNLHLDRRRSQPLALPLHLVHLPLEQLADSPRHHRGVQHHHRPLQHQQTTRSPLGAVLLDLPSSASRLLEQALVSRALAAPAEVSLVLQALGSKSPHLAERRIQLPPPQA